MWRRGKANVRAQNDLSARARVLWHEAEPWKLCEIVFVVGPVDSRQQFPQDGVFIDVGVVGTRFLGGRQRTTESVGGNVPRSV